jgi:hypothetical protein
MRIDMPGVGGSLGQCVLCGGTFLNEIMTGGKVQTIYMEGFSRALPVHKKCCDDVEAISKQHGDDPDSWKFLPEGPLRQEFQRAIDEAKTRGAAS